MANIPDPEQIAKVITLVKEKLGAADLSDPDLLYKIGLVLAAIGKSPAIKEKGNFGKGLEALIFYVFYGAFLSGWSSFDLTIELLIMRQLKLAPLEASIVCGGIGFGAKIEMLYSLLTRDENNADTDGVALLKEAHKLAARNSFAHGFMDYDNQAHQVLLVTRDVKTEYAAKIKRLDYKLMLTHLLEFMQKIVEIANHFKIPNDDLNNYRKAIEDHAQAHASRAAHRRESLTNSQSSKRQRRTQPRE